MMISFLLVVADERAQKPTARSHPGSMLGVTVPGSDAIERSRRPAPDVNDSCGGNGGIGHVGETESSDSTEVPDNLTVARLVMVTNHPDCSWQQLPAGAPKTVTRPVEVRIHQSLNGVEKYFLLSESYSYMIIPRGISGIHAGPMFARKRLKK